MDLSTDLIKLAELFAKKNSKLYVVGGAVRDYLLGYEYKDIDLAGSLPIEKVIKLCEKLNFKTKIINKNLGTLQIGKEQYEYTQFRIESYTNHKHSPDSVEFVEDITMDVARRDITINSLYLDITENRIVDLCGGQKDLTKKIIRSTNQPEITLKDDGLRILRIIRFASLLNFKIDKKTYRALKIFKANLKDIAKERILGELNQIVVADLVHNNNNHNFLKLFNKLNLYPYIFNAELTRIKKISNRDIKAYYKLTKECRLIGLYFLILKNYFVGYNNIKQISFICNSLLGLDGIKESGNSQKIVEKLFLIYQNLCYNIDQVNASINYLSLSNAEREIVLKFLPKQAKNRLEKQIQFIKETNMPLGIHDLKISSQDLIDSKIDNIYISKILNTLFNQVIESKVKNEKEDLINLAKNIHETFKDINKRSKL